MNGKNSRLQFLVIVTSLAAALIIAVGAYFEASSAPSSQIVGGSGRPRIGQLSAKIEILVIEDIRCQACQFFTEKIFPRIHEKYIETGRAYCIIVPVSFLEGSRRLANAALAVHHIAPEKFLSYYQELFSLKDQELNKDLLLSLAKKVGNIDVGKLSDCIETECYSRDLEENLAWAQRIMGRHFGTPALYINGMKISALSFEQISQKIEKLEMR
jgi:protein-disulfide isomerase